MFKITYKVFKNKNYIKDIKLLCNIYFNYFNYNRFYDNNFYSFNFCYNKQDRFNINYKEFYKNVYFICG